MTNRYRGARSHLYRLARLGSDGHSPVKAGDFYTTKKEAREAAPDVNRARKAEGAPLFTHVAGNGEFEPL